MKRIIERKNTSNKFDEFIAKNKFKCKCTHTMFIRPAVKRIICTHCGCWVYRKKSDEFKDKLNKRLNGDGLKCL